MAQDVVVKDATLCAGCESDANWFDTPFAACPDRAGEGGRKEMPLFLLFRFDLILCGLTNKNLNLRQQEPTANTHTPKWRHQNVWPVWKDFWVFERKKNKLWTQALKYSVSKHTHTQSQATRFTPVWTGSEWELIKEWNSMQKVKIIQ